MNKETTIGIVSLGCSKNLVDSEVMMGELKNANYSLTDDPSKAEILIVNTCAFIESATQESIDTILEMAEYKKTGKCRYLIVTGCLAERYRDEIVREIPEVDGILGTKSYTEILSCIEALKQDEKALMLDGNGINARQYRNRLVSTGKTTAFLKISEGCNNACTYCIIPKLRGRYQSRPMEDIISEAKELAQNGIRELIVIAQDTSYYGMDLNHTRQLPELLMKLAEIEGLHWIRVHYCYPEQITPELVTAMKHPKICPYLDIPIQHCNDQVLKRMGRRTNKDEILRILSYLRKEIPNIAIRTSIIVGFPGETEQDFEELKEFIQEVRFERLGVFAYSKEEGTSAARLPDQIPENIKEDRRRELMSVQHKIAQEDAQKHIGEMVEVLTEGHDGLLYFGRSKWDSADIDCKVYFASGDEVEIGSFVAVKIINTDEYDLIGEAIE